MQENDCVALPFRALAQRMADGRLSSLALVRECLDRIERDYEQLHAFIRVFDETALEHAKRLDDERAAGKVRGPLHGIPIAIKDLADIEGEITGFGSKAYSTAPATRTAPFIEALEEAGMIVIGKTHMVEFAFGSWGTNHALGTPKNPHSTAEHFVPGGSSSGSAVAVAAGLVPAAIGTDTGGSVRIPAALCGIVGLKTTTGLISTEGVAPLSPSLDTIGPMTRHVEDARLIFEAMCAAPPRANQNRTIALRYVERHALEPLDEEIWTAYAEALSLSRKLGLSVRPLALPRPLTAYQADSGTIMAREAYLELGHLVDDPKTPLDPFVRARVASGADFRDEAIEALSRERHTAMEGFKEILPGNEVLVLPTTPYPAIPLSDVDESIFPMSRFTRIANYLELCGLSMPCGRTRSGMPIGLQLVAAGGSEDMLLTFAAQLESSA